MDELLKEELLPEKSENSEAELPNSGEQKSTISDPGIKSAILSPEQKKELPPEVNVGDLTEKEKVFLQRSKENPLGGIYDPVTKKWTGYRAQKGVTPNWRPFDADQKDKAHKLTFKERKFLSMLSVTGELATAYRAAYRVKDYGNKALENSRVHANAMKVIRRLRTKAPDLVNALTFQEFSDMDTVKRGLIELYHDPKATIHEKTRILELVGKTYAGFSDKVQTETKITEVIKTVYKESDEDFPDVKDNRIGHPDMAELIGKA